MYSKHARNQALSVAVQDVYWAELEHLDDLAQQQALTAEEVLRQQDVLLRTGSGADYENLAGEAIGLASSQVRSLQRWA